MMSRSFVFLIFLLVFPLIINCAPAAAGPGEADTADVASSADGAKAKSPVDVGKKGGGNAKPTPKKVDDPKPDIRTTLTPKPIAQDVTPTALGHPTTTTVKIPVVKSTVSSTTAPPSTTLAPKPVTEHVTSTTVGPSPTTIYLGSSSAKPIVATTIAPPPTATTKKSTVAHVVSSTTVVSIDLINNQGIDKEFDQPIAQDFDPNDMRASAPPYTTIASSDETTSISTEEVIPSNVTTSPQPATLTSNVTTSTKSTTPDGNPDTTIKNKQKAERLEIVIKRLKEKTTNSETSYNIYKDLNANDTDYKYAVGVYDENKDIEFQNPRAIFDGYRSLNYTANGKNAFVIANPKFKVNNFEKCDFWNLPEEKVCDEVEKGEFTKIFKMIYEKCPGVTDIAVVKMQPHSLNGYVSPSFDADAFSVSGIGLGDCFHYSIWVAKKIV